MGQLILVFFFIVLAAGIVAVTHLFSVGRSEYGFVHYRRHLLYLNLFVFVNLAERYFKFNIISFPSGFDLFSLIHVFATGLSALFVFGLSYELIRAILEFQSRRFQRAVSLFFIATGAISFLGLGAAGTLFVIQLYRQLLDIVYKSSISMAMIVAVIVLFRSLFLNGLPRDVKQRNLLYGFISCYLMGFTAVYLGMIIGYSADLYIPIVIVFLINLFSVFWSRMWLSSHRPGIMPFVLKSGELAKIIRRYGISDREKRILELILQGKSNREIKEELFISIHTVKNHVYSIYQKLGIRSRGQLQRFIINSPFGGY